MSTTTGLDDRAQAAGETAGSAARQRLRDTAMLFGMAPVRRIRLLDPSEAIQETTRVTRRLIEVNAEYLRDLAGAVRKHMTGLAGVVRDEVTATATIAGKQVQQFEDVTIEQADELKRRRQTEARETEKAVRHTAEERYRDMTKAELSDELAKRELPRTGTVDELRARLVGDDLHYTA